MSELAVATIGKPVVKKDRGEGKKRGRQKNALERETKLRVACSDALRAWLRADKEGMPEPMHQKMLNHARLLTGRAVDLGLLGDLYQPHDSVGESG